MFLVSTSIVVGIGLILVNQAKTTRPFYDPKLAEAENLSAILADDPDKVVFSSYSQPIEEKKLFDLNRVRETEDTLPALLFSPQGNKYPCAVF